MSTETDTFTEMVGALDIEHPCFYHQWSLCGPAPARWVMHAACSSCGHIVRRLVCGADKNILLSTEAGLACADCGDVTTPAHHAYFLVEWLR